MGSVRLSDALCTATGSTTARSLAARFADVVNVKDYGAVGDGVTDDTAALAAAVATGKTVKGAPGETYAVDGGTISVTAGQVIDLTGCTVKLKASATSKGILRLNGAWSRVIGGTWDMNVANNGSDTDGGYNTWAVLIAADHASVEGAYIRDSYGHAIKVAAGAEYAQVRNNRIENTGGIDNGIAAIYIDTPGASDAYGITVSDNFIDNSASTTAAGIGLYSSSPFTSGHRRWAIQNNHVIMSASAANDKSVGITARGVDGIVSGNRVSGGSIGISVDLSQPSRSIVSGNHVKGANGTPGYGIEVNGGQCVITGNRVEGGLYGIAGSTTNTASAALDGTAVVGNVIEGTTVAAISFSPNAANSARHLTIAGNTITATDGKAVLLKRDCRYALITGNGFRGPGSGTGDKAIELDTTNSDVVVRGNTFSAWTNALSLYNAAATAQDRIVFECNDTSDDGPSSVATMVVLSGLATWGDRVRIVGNFTGNVNVLAEDCFDRANSRVDRVCNTWATPEGNLSAGLGSTYRKTVGNPPRFFFKQTGTGNTGWRPVLPLGRDVATYGASVSIYADRGDQFVITATNGSAFTITNPQLPMSGQRITIRVRNASGGALGAITWGTEYKLPTWTSPADGYSRSIVFEYDGADWIAVAWSAADVPN